MGGETCRARARSARCRNAPRCRAAGESSDTTARLVSASGSRASSAGKRQARCRRRNSRDRFGATPAGCQLRGERISKGRCKLLSDRGYQRKSGQPQRRRSDRSLREARAKGRFNALRDRIEARGRGLTRSLSRMTDEQSIAERPSSSRAKRCEALVAGRQRHGGSGQLGNRSPCIVPAIESLLAARRRIDRRGKNGAGARSWRRGRPIVAQRECVKQSGNRRFVVARVVGLRTGWRC